MSGFSFVLQLLARTSSFDTRMKCPRNPVRGSPKALDLSNPKRDSAKSSCLAQWSYGDRLNAIHHTPCNPHQKPCAECRQMIAACGDSGALTLLLSNSCEVFVDTTGHSKITGQAPSVPIAILNPGQIVGFVPSRLNPAKHQPGFLATSQSQLPKMKVTAGARSVFLGAPLNDEELTSRVFGLTKNLAAYERYSASLGFEKDPLTFVRLLSEALEHPAKIQMPWRVEVIVVPSNVLHDLFRSHPALEINIRSLEAAQEHPRTVSAYLGKHFSQVSYADEDLVTAEDVGAGETPSVN
jgi:hypothetical protein